MRIRFTPKETNRGPISANNFDHMLSPKMVAPTGIEPVSLSGGGKRSRPLNYGAIMVGHDGIEPPFFSGGGERPRPLDECPKGFNRYDTS